MTLTVNLLIDAINALPSASSGSPPRKGRQHDKAVDTYFRTFLHEMEEMVANTLFLPARDTNEAVRQSAKISQYITYSPLHASQSKAAVLSPEQRNVFDTFAAAFQEQGGRVLLLGDPGAGKSTTLLQFACEVARAGLSDIAQPDLPLPVFNSVHRWDSRAPLKTWAQSYIKHEFPNLSLGKRALLYLFDGLDELSRQQLVDPKKPDGDTYDPRVRFLEAIAQELPDALVVVSCRREDYDDLGVKAKLQGAVTLLPLGDDQIQDFLRLHSQPYLWQTLKDDLNLRELIRTPLLLALLSLAVGEDKGDMGLNPVLTTKDVTAGTIFDFYIRQRFAHEASKRDLPFDETTTRLWLGELAASMWKYAYEPSTTINVEVLKSLSGKHYNNFLAFACSMHFLRRTSSNTVRFIHLKFRDYCAVPTLVKALKDNTSAVRENTALALGRVGDVSAVTAVTALMEALKEEDSDFRWSLASALGNIGPDAIPALVEALKDNNAIVSKSVSYALGKIGAADAVPALVEALKDNNYSVRWSVASALGAIMDAGAVPALIEALNDQFSHVRESVVSGLVRIGDDAIPALVEALEDEDFRVREGAKSALSRMGISHNFNFLSISTETDS